VSSSPLDDPASSANWVTDGIALSDRTAFVTCGAKRVGIRCVKQLGAWKSSPARSHRRSSHARHQQSTIGTADSQTQIGWEVEDLQTEIDDIRARGVPIEEYDTPELVTHNGIADVGFAWMAWIIDPGKNALAIVQLKE